MSNIITFYSYKGGVGRSMSLANTAVLLSKWGYKVLIVDWDLEAPGLEHFFSSYFDTEILKTKIGIIDLLNNDNTQQWYEALIPISSNDFKTPIHFISSGVRDESYFKKVRNFDIDRFYEFGGGNIIENLRNDWKRQYDFVLIDSRTGITEIGGICTVQLPDKIVLFFTATSQGFEGTLDIAERATKAQQKLPFDRQKLLFIPIPTKFDTQAEYKLSQYWLDLFSEKLVNLYKSWLPISIKARDFIEITKIPYSTYFSFGKKLPVIEQGTNEPTGLGYAYENLASLLANNLNDVENLIRNRDSFIEKAELVNLPVKEDKSKKSFKIFISYSIKDREYKDRLKSHLSILTSQFNVKLWDDELIKPGERWRDLVKENIKQANLVLLLVSPNYLNSSYAEYELDLLDNTNSYVVPIIIKPTDWENSIVSNYQVLPRSMDPISNSKDIDSAFLEITKEIRNIVAINYSAPSLYFSHSSEDTELLSIFVKAARIGLNLAKKDIRISSEESYGFEAGESIYDITRQDIVEANILIGVITPSSLQSDWVKTELSARWSANKSIYLIVANGATFADIPSFLNNIVAKSCTLQELESLFSLIGKKLDKSYDFQSTKELLKECEQYSIAMADATNEQPGETVNGYHATAKVNFLSPPYRITNKGPVNYEIRCTRLPTSNNSLWLCIEYDKKIWPKRQLYFEQVDDSLKSSIIDVGSSLYFFLIVIEVNSIGQNQIEKWLAHGALNNEFPGIEKLTGDLLAHVQIVRKN